MFPLNLNSDDPPSICDSTTTTPVVSFIKPEKQNRQVNSKESASSPVATKKPDVVKDNFPTSPASDVTTTG